MTTVRPKAPAYRHFKPKNLAVVRINGKDFYLGKYDSPESWQEYHRRVAEWHGSKSASPNGSPPQPRNGFFGVSCLIEAYLKFAETYYRQGTWTVEVHDTHGKPASKRFLALEHQGVFTKDGITMKSKGGEGRKGKFRLDEKQDPKTLDITLEPGLQPGPKAPVPEKEVLSCIYSLDGDTLKVCYGLSQDRPAAFESTAEPVTGLVVLRRQPPPKEEPNKD